MTPQEKMMTFNLQSKVIEVIKIVRNNDFT